MLACKNKQLTSGLVSKTWDIGELFKITPTLIFKPWDTGETYETSIFPRTKINNYNLILCDSKVPEVEIDPGPLPLNLVNKEDQELKSQVKIPPMSNEFKTWIAYIQDIKFKILLMLTMILLPLSKVMVPEVEIDPGPCPQPISLITKLNYLPRLILPEVSVLFRTWISYINKLIPWFQSKLKSTSNQVIYGEVFNIKNYFKKKFSSTKHIYLYHDHYMIDVFITTKYLYLYHDHYMIGILFHQVQTFDKKNSGYHKSGKTFHRKAVRFKN
jgi:hypothetical protein